MACINGKATRNPRNLDFYVTYYIMKGKKVNFGWIFLAVVLAYLTKKTKALPFANCIYVLLKHLGIDLDSAHFEKLGLKGVYDVLNISQIKGAQKHQSQARSSSARVDTENAKESAET